MGVRNAILPAGMAEALFFMGGLWKEKKGLSSC